MSKKSRLGGGAARAGSKYYAVAEKILERIDSGVYGQTLPGQRSLAEEFKVTPVTMSKAVNFLKERGFVRTEPGNGTFIARLKRRRTHTIGVVVHSIPGGVLHQQLMFGLHERSHEAGEHLLMNGHRGQSDRELCLVREMVEHRQVDGVVLWPLGGNDRSEAVNYLCRESIPYVLIPNLDLNVYADSTTVYSDDFGSVGRIIEHLLANECRKIGFLAKEGFKAAVPFRERWLEYRECLLRHGLEMYGPILCGGDFVNNEITMPENIHEMLAGLDAVICATDAVAGALISNCVAHGGIRVPGDLAVVGHDNTMISEVLSVTSIDQRFTQIGEKAITLLLDEIEGRRTEPVHVSVRSELILRRSTEKHVRTM